MLASLVVVVVEVDLGSSILLIASSCKIVIVATSSTFFMDSSSVHVQAVRLLTSRAHHAQDLLMTSMQLSCWPSFDKGQNFTAGNDGSSGS